LVWTSPSQLGVSGSGYLSLAATVEQRLASIPGVRAAKVSNGAMVDGISAGGESANLKVESVPSRAGLVTRTFAVAPGFFTAAGVRLIEGRDLSDFDTDRSPRVAVVNETWAHFFFGSASAVGKHYGGQRGTDVEIIGVVKDARVGSMRTATGVTYTSYRQNPS